jgi:membrane associated rhomboid family serine protease
MDTHIFGLMLVLLVHPQVNDVIIFITIINIIIIAIIIIFHSLVYPGAYGLFGACLAYVLFNRTYEKTWLVADHVKLTITILIIITLLVQIIYDICYYILQYNEGVSYASHIFGLYSGFMIALSSNIYRKLYIYKIIGIISLVAVLMQIIYLLYNHYHYWPPRPYIQSWIHNESSCNGCCSQLYRYMSKYSLSYEQAISTVECIDDHLYPPF